jgi:5-methylcytosine-specific restriction endonuclease McrA
MEPTTHTAASSVSSQLASIALPASPTELSDAELLTATRRLVGRSNQLLASLLAHLGEVEARGIHRVRACASLYAYCIYELRFSEDEAFRRVSAARLVRRFPMLLEAVAAGELHLTGLLMLGPLLTPDNVGEVLARAKHRTKKELARLVRSLDPLPAVPPRIEPLGPAPLQLAPEAPSWSRWMSAMNPVRELESGARPRDWIDGAFPANRPELLDDGPESAEPAPARVTAVTTSAEHPLAPAAREGTATILAEHAPARLEPQRYKVQFEASEEYVELAERAKALLSHRTPRTDLSELHLRAMRTLVAELERQKYAVTARPRRRAPGSTQAGSGHRQEAESEHEHEREHESQFKPEPESEARHESEPESEDDSRPEPPRRRGRHVPAAIRRAVFERDHGRCTYASDSGERCRETALLELHHSLAFARGGAHRLDNVTLRCRAHNTLAAEEDFGRDFVALVRDSAQHET